MSFDKIKSRILCYKVIALPTHLDRNDQQIRNFFSSGILLKRRLAIDFLALKYIMVEEINQTGSHKFILLFSIKKEERFLHSIFEALKTYNKYTDCLMRVPVVRTTKYFAIYGDISVTRGHTNQFWTNKSPRHHKFGNS